MIYQINSPLHSIFHLACMQCTHCLTSNVEHILFAERERRKSNIFVIFEVLIIDIRTRRDGAYIDELLAIYGDPSISPRATDAKRTDMIWILSLKNASFASSRSNLAMIDELLTHNLDRSATAASKLVPTVSVGGNAPVINDGIRDELNDASASFPASARRPKMQHFLERLLAVHSTANRHRRMRVLAVGAIAAAAEVLGALIVYMRLLIVEAMAFAVMRSVSGAVGRDIAVLLDQDGVATLDHDSAVQVALRDPLPRSQHVARLEVDRRRDHVARQLLVGRHIERVLHRVALDQDLLPIVLVPEVDLESHVIVGTLVVDRMRHLLLFLLLFAIVVRLHWRMVVVVMIVVVIEMVVHLLLLLGVFDVE
mmetsp:Transcript_26945/g.42646  ORF Transcript_26945/g.42646 Transcript_26945/m.42646 type:complete len:368 (+) Transcript_26945:359-1462(+)